MKHLKIFFKYISTHRSIHSDVSFLKGFLGFLVEKNGSNLYFVSFPFSVVIDSLLSFYLYGLVLKQYNCSVLTIQIGYGYSPISNHFY